jgi:hypothetical protein
MALPRQSQAGLVKDERSHGGAPVEIAQEKKTVAGHRREWGGEPPGFLAKQSCTIISITIRRYFMCSPATPLME